MKITGHVRFAAYAVPMAFARDRFMLAAAAVAVLAAAGTLTGSVSLRPVNTSAVLYGSSAVSAPAVSRGPVTGSSSATVSALSVAAAPNNPSFGEQWSLDNTGQVLPTSSALHGDAPAGFAGTPGDDIDILGAWPYSLGAGVVVAVVDTGVDYNAPGLAGQLVAGYNFIRPGALPQDDNGHGTHVSGIIAAAQNNGVGISGIAPATKIMPLKAMNAQGQGSSANLAAAFAYAGAHGVRIVNASFSSLNPSPALAAVVAPLPEHPVCGGCRER